MSLIDDLGKLGVNVEDGLERFMNNSPLYERMLKKLPAVLETSCVMPCFEAGDLEKAYSNAHTIKGVVGNLSIDPLYKGYSGISSLLRDGKNDEARALLEKTLELEQPIVECIKKYSD